MGHKQQFAYYFLHYSLLCLYAHNLSHYFFFLNLSLLNEFLSLLKLTVFKPFFKYKFFLILISFIVPIKTILKVVLFSLLN